MQFFFRRSKLDRDRLVFRYIYVKFSSRISTSVRRISFLKNTFDFLYSILYSRNFSTLLSHCLAISIDPSNRSICKIEEKITRNIVQLFVNHRTIPVFPERNSFLKELQLFIGTGFLRSPFLSRLLEDKKKKEEEEGKEGTHEGSGTNRGRSPAFILLMILLLVR